MRNQFNPKRIEEIKMFIENYSESKSEMRINLRKLDTLLGLHKTSFEDFLGHEFVMEMDGNVSLVISAGNLTTEYDLEGLLYKLDEI